MLISKICRESKASTPKSLRSLNADILGPSRDRMIPCNDSGEAFGTVGPSGGADVAPLSADEAFAVGSREIVARYEIRYRRDRAENAEGIRRNHCESAWYAAKLKIVCIVQATSSEFQDKRVR